MWSKFHHQTLVVDQNWYRSTYITQNISRLIFVNKKFLTKILQSTVSSVDKKGGSVELAVTAFCVSNVTGCMCTISEPWIVMLQLWLWQSFINIRWEYCVNTGDVTHAQCCSTFTLAVQHFYLLLTVYNSTISVMHRTFQKV